MKKLVLALAAVLLVGCQWGNLGFYVYPQAASTGNTEESGPLAGMEVVGYLLSSRIPRIDASQARHLTDLVYFSVSARLDGTVGTESLIPARIDFLKKVKREYGTRILLSVSDHSRQGPLSVVVRSPALRAKLATDLADVLTSYGFDGADFDWEYPASEDLAAYGGFLGDVRAAFAPKGLRLSVAVTPEAPLTAAAYEAVDRVHGMLYDDDGRHSTLEKSAAHVQSLIAQGVPASKLLMGLPFYGRGYTDSRPWSSAVSYRTLHERYQLKPGQDTVSGYYFNGVDTVRQKVRYAKSAGLSGVMVWEIGQDTDDNSSLLGAITAAREELAGLN